MLGGGVVAGDTVEPVTPMVSEGRQVVLKLDFRIRITKGSLKSIISNRDLVERGEQ